MLIFDNSNDAIILESIHTPLAVEHFWVLDFSMMDYTLAPLLVLEETWCPVIDLMINGFVFSVPTNWNILVADLETSQLDVVQVGNLSGNEFKAVAYGPNESRAELLSIKTVDYHAHRQIIGPSLNKHQMLCHPIGPSIWVNVAPSDAYNKYLKNTTLGHIT